MNLTAGQETIFERAGLAASDLFSSLTIAFLGNVAAGAPLEPIEEGDQIKVPRFLLSGGKNFALRVRGDSMTGDGVRDGDILVVRCQSKARSGQTVVAIVNGEATLKRIYRTAGRVELRPANPAMKSIFLDASSGSVEIRGVVIGLIRPF